MSFNVPIDAWAQRIAKNEPTEVALSYRSIDNSACIQLATAFANNTSVRVLDLQGNNIGPTGIAALCDALASNTTLTELNLENNQLDEATAERLATLLESNNSLLAVGTGGNNLSGAVTERIAWLTQLNGQPPEMKRMATAISSNDPAATALDLTGDSGSLSTKLLFDMLSANTTVRSLNLSSLGTGDKGADMVGRLVALPTSVLEEVDLSNNGIGAHGVADLCAGAVESQKLTSLRLASNKISDDAARLLVDMLRRNDSVTDIDLTDNAVSRAVLDNVNRSLDLNRQPLPLKRALHATQANDPATTEVNLSWVGGMSRCMSFLVSALKSNAYITDLCVSNSKCGDEGARHVATVLATNRTIKVIAMANSDVTSAGALDICRSLTVNSVVQDVNLANNAIETPAGIAFGEMLSTNNHITALNLELNDITEEVMQDIEGLLVVNQQPLVLKRLLPTLEANSRAHTALDFSTFDGHRYFNDNSVAVLVHALSHNSMVTRLDLSNNNVGDQGAVALASLIKNNGPLESLILRENSIADRGAAVLSEALIANTTLVELDLHGNCVGADGGDHFREMLRKNDVLVSLQLESNRLPRTQLNEIRIACAINTQPPSLKALLPRIRARDPTLEAIDVSKFTDGKFYGDAAISILCHELVGNGIVKVVNLANNVFESDGARALSEVLVDEDCAIVELNCANNTVGDTGAQYFAHALARNRSLRSVSLENNAIGDRGVEDLIEALKTNDTLTKLNVERNDVADAVVRTLEDELRANCQPLVLKRMLPVLSGNSPSVTAINFSGGDGNGLLFDDTCCRMLAVALCFNTVVNALDLSNNDISSKGAAYIADLLEENKGLLSISLAGNHIDDAGADKILTALGINSTLVEMDLSENQISDEKMDHIQYALILNGVPLSLKNVMADLSTNEPSLTQLDFDRHHDDDPIFDVNAMSVLCSVLVNNTHVATLSMRHNRVGDAGAVALSDVLRRNTTLTAVHLDNNNIGRQGVGALAEALKSNHTVGVMTLDGNPTSFDALEEVTIAVAVNSQPLKPALVQGGGRVDVLELDDQTQFRDFQHMKDVECDIFADAMRDRARVGL